MAGINIVTLTARTAGGFTPCRLRVGNACTAVILGIGVAVQVVAGSIRCAGGLGNAIPVAIVLTVQNHFRTIEAYIHQAVDMAGLILDNQARFNGLAVTDGTVELFQAVNMAGMAP